MPRTLTVRLPFARGATISDSDPNWSSVATSDSGEVELWASNRTISYPAQRKQLGKSTIAMLIRLSRTGANPKAAPERQSTLFSRRDV
jgi:hypothetical protein